MKDGALIWLQGHPAARRLKKEIGRFTMVGAINALLTFAIFTTLLKIVHVDYHIALLAAWLCGTVFSYCLNFVWVFTQPDQLTFDSRFVKFVVTGLLSIALNLATLHLLVKTTGADPFLLQIALMPPIVGFNFLAAKFWSLTRDGG